MNASNGKGQCFFPWDSTGCWCWPLRCGAIVAQSHSTANDWGIKQGDAVTAQLVSASIPIPKAEQSDNIVANESKGVTQTQPEAKPVEKPPDDAVPIQGKVKPPSR